MRKRHILICIAAILICVLAFDLVARYRGERDFEAITRGDPPVFAINPRYPTDGGSVEFSGFGYTLLRMHQKWQGKYNGCYRVGPRLEYWLPLPVIAPNRDNTIITTNN